MLEQTDELLKAVNEVRGRLSANPISDVGSTDVDTSAAIQQIETASEDLQRKGFWFSVREVELSPDNNGHIILDKDVVAVISDKYVHDNGKLRDSNWNDVFHRDR